MSNIISNKYIPQNFAPVLIPTLCRYTHFVACLESLMKCTWAENTDVYIGLDYPAKESHWTGYKEICKYLEEISKTHNFKKLTVIKREHNYGLGKNGNLLSLIQDILKVYDSYILSEDDNVFAPGFLDYINKGLEKFKDDKSVLAICGYRHFYNIKFENNTFFRQNVDFSAWGYGTWKNRESIFQNVSRKDIRMNLSLPKLFKIKKDYGNLKLIDALSYSIESTKPFIIIDRVLSVFMILSNIDIIMPTQSLVRNIGVDGSGENFKNIDNRISTQFSLQNITSDKIFNYVGTGFEHYNENRNAYVAENIDSISEYSFIYRLFRLLAKLIIERLLIYIKLLKQKF